MADQWFAVFDGATGNLDAVGSVVTFPLAAGLRAVTVDGPANGRFWDKTTLNFVTTPPQPPPQPPVNIDPMPFLQDGGDAPLTFSGAIGANAVVTFSTKFTVPPRVTGLIVASYRGAPGGSFMDLQVGSITKDGMIIYAKAAGPLNYTQPVTWSVEQRWRDKA